VGGERRGREEEVYIEKAGIRKGEGKGVGSMVEKWREGWKIDPILIYKSWHL